MELSDALDIIRNLPNLHDARRRALVAVAVELRDRPDELRRHVYRCRAEDADVADRATKWFAEEAERVRIANLKPEKKWQKPAYTVNGPVAPPERPVTVTWGEATKAGRIAVVRRPEGINTPADISRPVELPPTSRHGTHHAYAKYKCRCNPCREAKKQAQTISEFEHGTRRGYMFGRCRCEACRAANARYQREYKKSREAQNEK